MTQLELRQSPVTTCCDGRNNNTWPTMDLKAIINDAPGQESQNSKASSQLPPTPTTKYRPSSNGLPDGNISPGLYSNASISPSTDATHDGKRKRSIESDYDGAPPLKATRPLSQPRRKTIKPPPIWAQQARGLPPLKKYRKASSRTPAVNGPAVNGASKIVPGPQLAKEPPPVELSPYEETFDNTCPSDEVARYVCDFLFRCIMQYNTLEAGQTGSVPSPHGQLEIEAKIGTLIDRNTDLRMMLPVRTEAILAETHDVSFVSNMTTVRVHPCS